jgi:group I intron endonuclease
MMNDSGIYQIRSIKDGKLYVGSSVDIGKRWKTHINCLNLGKHHAHHLEAAWVKYRSENFVFEIIEYCDKSQLIEREQYYIDTLKPEYNTSPTAGNRLGMKEQLETRKRKIATPYKKRFFRLMGRLPTEEEVSDWVNQMIDAIDHVHEGEVLNMWNNDDDESSRWTYELSNP